MIQKTAHLIAALVLALALHTTAFAAAGDAVVPVDTIDEVTWELIQATPQWDLVRQYLPYMSSDNVARLLDYVDPIYGRNSLQVPDTYLGNGKKPFSREALTVGKLDALVLELMQFTGNMEFVSPWFPHMTADGVRSVEALYRNKQSGGERAGIAKSAQNGSAAGAYGTGPDAPGDGFDYSVLSRLDTLCAAQVDALALEYIAASGQFSYVYNMRQFMTVSGIDAAVAAYVEQGGEIMDVSAMLQFMSADTARKVAGQYLTQRTDKSWDHLFQKYL